MRITVPGDTARSLLNVGARLGVACGMCRHRVIRDLSTLLDQIRDIRTFKFKCAKCGEVRTISNTF
jgi:hypothetical protein